MFVQNTDYTSSVNCQILELFTQLKNEKICAKIFCIIFIHDSSNTCWFYGTLNYKIGCFSCIYSYSLGMFWRNYTYEQKTNKKILVPGFINFSIISFPDWTRNSANRRIKLLSVMVLCIPGFSSCLSLETVATYWHERRRCSRSLLGGRLATM